MRRTIRKLFWVWEFDEEEKWLAEQSAIGLRLEAVGWCKYIFDEGLPGEYTVRLELLNNVPTHPESVQYIKFVEDTGAEYLGSVFRWVYFRKKSDEGNFDLFSDTQSRIKHLNRILTLNGILIPVNLLSAINNISIYFSSEGFKANLIAGIFSAAATLLLSYGFIRIYLKRRKLKKESTLHE